MNLFHPVFSIEEARAYERSILGESDESIREAMENAGRAIGKALHEDYLELGKWPESPQLLVLCGKGLNTGDALVACQILHQRLSGLRVRLVLTRPEEELSPLVANALSRLRAMMGESLQSVDVAGYLSAPAFADEIVLDGLYGMGFKPPLREEPLQLLKQVNQRTDAALRVSIDLPSGMGASGCGENTFVADFTYIPGVAKRTVFERANRRFSGRIRFLEIDPFRKQTVAEDAALLLGSPKAYKILPKLRPADSDKRKFGHCLIVAGSADMPGAAVMSSLGALHAGAGLVTVLCPASVSARVAGVVPEAMWRALPLSPEGGLDVESVRVVSQVANKADALLIGPGLVMDRSTTFTICRMIRETPLPLVLDASALTQDVMTAVLGRQFSSGPVIITPHQGEYSRILGAREATDDPQSLVDFSRKFRVTSILKGHPTFISEGRRLFCLPVGGPVLARGGSGDILAGILATLLAQNKEDPLKAALMAVSWHGAAADSLARENGNLSLRTTDLLDHLGKTLRD